MLRLLRETATRRTQGHHDAARTTPMSGKLSEDRRANLIVRVGAAIHRAGGDHLGPVEDIHAAFIMLLLEAAGIRALLATPMVRGCDEPHTWPSANGGVVEWNDHFYEIDEAIAIGAALIRAAQRAIAKDGAE